MLIYLLFASYFCDKEVNFIRSVEGLNPSTQERSIQERFPIREKKKKKIPKFQKN